jgi:hypothetical protein
MSTRKLFTLLALTATVALGATAPAYAQSPAFKSWVNQTNSHYLALAQAIERAGRAQDGAAMAKGLGALVAYGDAHPPPPPDRADFLTAMEDLTQEHLAAQAGDGQAALQDGFNADHAIDHCPQPLPSWWRSAITLL